MLLEVAVCLIVVWCTWYIVMTYQSKTNMPPGPYPLPFIGNAHQLGSAPPFTMDKLWEKYGDIYQVQFPIGTFIIINSFAAAREALVTKKDDFAGRPIDLMYPVDIITQAKSVASADYGVKFLFRKKLLRSAFRVFGEGLVQVEERINRAVEELLQQIEKRNNDGFSIKYYISSTITNQLWGWVSSRRCHFGDKSLNDLVVFQEKMIYLLRQGTYFQLLPFMKYLPTEFTRTLAEVLRMRDEIFGTELDEHIRTYKEGTVRDIIDSLISSYELEKVKDGNRDYGTIMDIKFLLLDIIVAGADTSITTVSWFVLYMVLNQDIQAKVHEEIDVVVGRDRLPRWSDIKNLSYLQSCVCEVMRHTGFLPWMPHRAIRETSIGGYHVPKHTSVFINFYRIHRDPAEFDKPFEFNPGRFLDPDGKFLGWSGTAAFLPFGLGRRACIGQDLGKMQVFSVVSCLMHRFSFRLADGQPTPSLKDEVLGSLRHPVDYKLIAQKRL